MAKLMNLGGRVERKGTTKNPDSKRLHFAT